MATTKKTVAPAKKTSPKKATEPLKFAGKKVGNKFIATLGTEKFSATVTKEQADVLIKKITLYNKKPTELNKKSIIKLLSPKAVEVKKTIEKQEAKKKGYEKLVKKEKTGNKKEVAKKKADFTKAKSASKSDGLDLVVFTDNSIVLKGFEKIPMPDLLVDTLLKMMQKDLDIKPLLNFWSLCLLNPNEIARTRLFEYLSRHKFIITPSGYFVTYRMVKKTTNPGIFTDAHTGKFKIEIGKAVSIPREECDEDGSNDCSKGLHVGSPDFIGIEKGDGYGNTSTGQIGTGYTAYQSHSMYGDQPIIAFVNPMHVVSIPDSETRKLRCCEYYPFKLTTPQEVISIEDSNYFIFENDYKKLELEQLMSMIDKSKLKLYENTASGKKLKDLEKAIENLKVGSDRISKSLSLAEVKNILSERLVVLQEKFPQAVQLG